MNGCSQTKARSTTQRTLPSPEPWATPRRAISGVMPRFRSRRRVLVEVVAPVGVQAPWFAARASPQSPNRWDGVQQRQELGDVVPVAAGERDGKRGSVRSTIRWCLEPGRARSTGEGPT